MTGTTTCDVAARWAPTLGAITGIPTTQRPINNASRWIFIGVLRL